MASKKDCIRAVMAAGVDGARATVIVDDLLKKQKEINAAGDLGKAEAKLAALVREEAESARMESVLARKQAALVIDRRVALEDFAAGVKAEGGSFGDALQASLWGSHKRFSNSRSSAARRMEAIAREWQGSLVNELSAIPGARELLHKDQAFSGQVMREMIEPGLTNDPLARQVADIFSRHLEQARLRCNDAGANIGKLAGYAPQNHDPIRMIRHGQQAWTDAMLEHLDWERSFPGVTEHADRLDILDSLYATIVSGQDMRYKPEAEGALFRRPANVARGMEKHRTLHFKDAEAAVAYHERFGEGHVLNAVARKLNAAARKAGLMEIFGPNPESMIHNLLQAERRSLRSMDADSLRGLAKGREEKAFARLEERIDAARARGDEAEATALGQQWATKTEALRRDRMNELHRLWDGKRGGVVGAALAELTGETLSPVNPTGARIFSGVRSVQSMAKLGFATLSGLADVFVKAASLRHNGEGFASAWTKGLHMRIEGLQSRELVELGRGLGVYADSFLRDMACRFDSGDPVRGWLAQKSNTFFRLTGLEGWTEGHKASYVFYLSNRLADNAHLPFGQLQKDFAASLRRAGLADRWDVLRSLVRQEADGRSYILPERTRELADAVLETHIPERFREYQRPHQKTPEDLEVWESGRARELDRTRRNLASDLMGYFADETKYAVIEPDVKTRRFLTFGTRPGTVTGEIVRLATQFKSFPIAYGQRFLMERRWTRASRDAGAMDVPGMVNAIAGSMFMGYVAMTAKDLAKAKQPRDPFRWETVLAAALQSGGLGLAGDFLLGKSDRFGRDFTASIAGPTLSEFGRVVAIAGEAIRGETEHALDDTLRLTMGNTPYANIFWAKAALDYGLMFHLREWMSPGSLARAEKAMQEDFNQRYLSIGDLDMTPSRLIKRGGGFR